jgi:hypothetical protein
MILILNFVILFHAGDHSSIKSRLTHANYTLGPYSPLGIGHFETPLNSYAWAQSYQPKKTEKFSNSVQIFKFLKNCSDISNRVYIKQF